MNVCIIPCALDARAEISELFGNIPNLFIPHNGKPIIESIFKFYDKYCDKFVIVSNKSSFSKFEDYISNNNLSDKVFVTPIENIGDIGDTVKCGLDFAIEKFGNIKKLIINYGDTAIAGDYRTNFDTDKIFYSVTDEPVLWTAFDFSNGKVNSIIDKNDNIGERINNIFIGIFVIANITDFQSVLNELSAKDNTTNEKFYYALKIYSKKNAFQFEKCDAWIDVGHMNKYQESQNLVKPRMFNTIQTDIKRGILVKRSTEKEKFIGEILWYMNLPKDLQWVCPRVYDYSIDRNNTFVKMDLLTFPTLHELFLWSDFDFSVWDRITEKLLFILDEFSSHFKILPENMTASILKDMYVTKTEERILQLHSNESLWYYFDNDIIINGVKYHSLRYYLDRIDVILKNSGIYSKNRLCIIHGDYCSSNILADPSSGAIKLIDPRGKFGGDFYDVYGDPIYDLAKLLHNFDGNYDFIITDLFSAKINDNKEITVNLFVEPKHKKISERVLRKIKEKRRSDFFKAKIIESLLFLSMIPLHGDFQQRQIAMLATGVQQIDEIIKNSEGEI